MEENKTYKYNIEGMAFDQVKLPERIYKYRDWKDACHKRLLTNNEIYFAKPLNFKDHHELDFRIISDLVTQEKIEIVKQSINEKMSIFCVSEHKNNYALWKDFASAQSGFCVGINSRKMFAKEEIVGGGGKVSYYKKDNIPSLKLPYGNDKERRVCDFINVIMSLPVQYINEDEYRVFKFDIQNPQAIITIESIEEVVLGHHVSKPDEEEIINICKTRLPLTKLYKANYDYDLEYYSFTEIL